MVDLNIIHTANKSVWEINLSKTLTYTVVIYNISQEVLEELEVGVNIPVESEYVKNTCTINGKPYDYNSRHKICIPRLAPRENLIITLDVNMSDSETPCEVSSFTNVDYTKKKYSTSTSFINGSWNTPKAFCEKTTEDKTTYSTVSEISIVPVIFKKLFITHNVNKNIVRVGEIIEYKYIIKNDSSIGIEECLLENISNSSVKFLPDSLYINGVNIPSIDFLNKIPIGYISPKETILLSFKGRIMKVSNLNAISNKGILNFYYCDETNYNKPPEFIESNNLLIELSPSNTKSINLSKIETRPSCNPCIAQVVDIFNADVIVTSQTAVDSMSSQARENAGAIGKTICVTGYINGRVTYTSDTVDTNTIDNMMYILEYEIPFKTEILMNEHYSEYVKVIPKIAFIDATLIDTEKVYINAILDIDLIHG
ncbi:MAG: hypothetical protein ACRC3Y_13830 [Romboutsia sp.]|uniref:hypothetical protein n=1 Tax=Romboutsia sp. TaxID=1965302 RepID=UPI003F3C9DF6